MGEGGFYIEVASAGGKEQRRPAIDEDADGGDHHYNAAGDLNRVADAPDRLPGDPAGHDQQNDRVGERGENGAAAQPVSEPAARLPAAQHRRSPGQREAEDIAEIVPGIREQRERAGKYSGDRLAANVSEVQSDPNRKGAPVTRLGVRVRMVLHEKRLGDYAKLGLLNSQQLHIEHQCGVRRDYAARSAGAIAEFGRDDQGTLAADLHPGDAFVPPGNDLVRPEGELKRLATVD